jgi:hypothetical protein
VPNLSVEVKTGGSDVLLGALRQAEKNSGSKYPLVVWRPNGYGPEKIDRWVVVMSASEAMEILKLAGLL